MNVIIDGIEYQPVEQQLTLGELIDALEIMPDDTEIAGLGVLDSYRGYYCDLAFQPPTEKETAQTALENCEDAMGKVFTGYKGGDYMMGATTPLWVAHYGCTGQKIMAISPTGKLTLMEDD